MSYDSEKNFEKNIEAFLISDMGGWQKATDAGYNHAESSGKALDLATLISFVQRTQPKQWVRFEKQCNGDPRQRFYKSFEDAVTSVGDGTLLMAFVHVGHDAKIGNFVTIANQTAVAGHVIIEDRAVLSAYVLIHQFCRIGTLAMIGGRTILPQDVPPYCMLAENCRVCGPNVIGMRRAGMDSDTRLAIRKAIKTYFFKDLNGTNALAEIESQPMTPEVAHFADFIRQSERGIMAGASDLDGFMFDED